MKGDRHLPTNSWRHQDSSVVKKDTIENTNIFVSIERGARDLFVHLRACCGTFAFPVLTFSLEPPTLARLHSAWFKHGFSSGGENRREASAFTPYSR